MKPISSAITGALRQVETRQSSTGAQRGATGSELALTDDKARARLDKPPAETDRNLAQWLASCGGDVRLKTEFRYPKEGGYRSEIVGATVSGLTPAAQSKAASAWRAATTKPTIRQAEEWVTMLHAATAHRTEDGAGLDVSLSLYASTLAQFPADVAKHACLNLALRPDKPNWWPTLSEVVAEATALASRRRAILRELEA